MRYFIDTNVIIDLLKNEKKAKDVILPLLNDEQSELYINRIVLSESLRTIRYKDTKKFQYAKSTLELFTQLDITPDIYQESIEFSRFCISKGVTLKGKCALMDFLHFITAKHYNLKIVTFDNDFEKLETKYEEFK